MAKKVALVGHCGPDSSYLRMVVQNAGRDAKQEIKVLSADDSRELQQVLDGGVDLLLFNRELGYGFNDEMGADAIQRLRAQYPGLKMILVSNHSDAQAAAVANGALPGFGKRELGTPKVAGLLKDALQG